MPPVAQILAQRQVRRKKALKDPKPRWALWLSGFLSLWMAWMCLAAAWIYLDIHRELPSINLLSELLSPPNGALLQPTRLYDRSGKHLLLVLQNPAAMEQRDGEIDWQGTKRKYLYIPASGETEQSQLEKEFIPTTAISSTIAIADPDFWQHAGFSWDGLMNGSHPTIAQKLVSDLLLNDDEPGLRRNLRERLLAFQATSIYGKTRILEWYLNSANYGRIAYGIEEASTLYFGHPAAQLSLAEAAMLAGVSQEPELNPHDAPQAALERQKRVFQKMLDLRLITPEEALQAVQQQLATRPATRTGQSLQITDLSPNLAPAFASLAVAELDQILGRSRFERGGMSIITSLDFDSHIQAKTAATAQMAQFFAPDTVDLSELCQMQASYAAWSSQSEDISNCPQADVVILDPQTGQLLVLLSSDAAGERMGVLPVHASGTLSIPFIYLTAFTQGLSPASLVWDTPSKNNFTADGKEDSYHGPVRLRVAMANDYLAATNKILQQVGAENIHQIGSRFGLPAAARNQTDTVSAQEFFGDLDLLQASRAYGIFANQGVLAGKISKADGQAGSQISDLKPITILSISDTRKGEIYAAGSAQTLPVLTSQIAYLVSHILRDMPAQWPTLGRPNPLELEYSVAVKLGRNSDNKSAWVIGYSPERVIGVWFGTAQEPVRDDEAKLGVAASAAANLWREAAQYNFSKQPYPTWSVPAGITNLEVCDPSGMLPTPECPKTIDEVFLSGNEPQQIDNLYQNTKVNRQTDTLATVFTPLDLIEERVFMIVPAEETDWLQTAGLPRPPEIFDTIPSEPPAWQGQVILSPSMFEPVNAKVAILGEVSVQDLSFFRIQVGQGLNPVSWMQLGVDHTTGAQRGVLETWDTSELEGIYTIQLMVVRQDQSIQRTSVIVTIDNQAPEVKILTPLAGETVSTPQNGDLILQAEIQDNLNIQEVFFFLDGEQIAQQTAQQTAGQSGEQFAEGNQPPYIAAWPPQPGEHQLRILAVDQAGNQTETESTFFVK